MYLVFSETSQWPLQAHELHFFCLIFDVKRNTLAIIKAFVQFSFGFESKSGRYPPVLIDPFILIKLNNTS